MAETNSGAGGQAPSGDLQASGQAPQVHNGGTPSSAPQAPQAGGGNTATNTADYERIISELRKENAAHRVKQKQIEEAQAAADLAKLGDTERLQKQFEQTQQQLTALQSEQKKLRLAGEIARYTLSLNLVDPDIAALMLTASEKIEYDADGQPTNVLKLLEALIAERPFLVASNVRTPPAAPSSGGATNPGRGPGVAGQPVANRPSVKDAYKQHKESGGLANPNLWKR